MSKKFWETTSLKNLNQSEWESLCDGCAKCCVNKIVDEEDNVFFTWSACKFLDLQTCQCRDYNNRVKIAPNCLKLTPNNIDEISPLLPKTCAYRLLNEGYELPSWHYLISGDKNLVHELDISIKEKAISEEEVLDDDLDLFIVEDDDF